MTFYQYIEKISYPLGYKIYKLVFLEAFFNDLYAFLMVININTKKIGMINIKNKIVYGILSTPKIWLKIENRLGHKNDGRSMINKINNPITIKIFYTNERLLLNNNQKCEIIDA